MDTLKIIKGVIIGTFISLSASSCSSGSVSHYYTTPIITGQVLDKTTNEPLSNVSIYENSIHQTQTDIDGYFKLPAFKFSYKASDYDVRSLNEASEGSFSIYKEGYKGKDIWNFGLKSLEIKHTGEVPYHIYLGRVYLEPLPKSMSVNNIENEYIKKMTFCKTGESQKEVNCIPVPDGMTYEQVNNNQL